MIHLKRIIAGICALFTVVLCGCNYLWRFIPSDPPNTYDGPYQELFSVAQTTLLGIFNSPKSEIAVLETDAYGRTLFAFRGGSGTVGKQGDPIGIQSEQKQLAVLICQCYDTSSATIYRNENYLLRTPEQSITAALSDCVAENFAATELDGLKVKNDWDKPLNAQKAKTVSFSLPIVNSPLQNAVETGLKEIGAEGRKLSIYPLEVAQDGRMLCFARFDDYGSGDEYLLEDGYLVLVEADSQVKTAPERLKNLTDYREQLADFEERNSWD